MYLITVENMNTGKSFEYEVSRVPCVNEYLYDKQTECSYVVVSVSHVLNADADNEPGAIVRVR